MFENQQLQNISDGWNFEFVAGRYNTDKIIMCILSNKVFIETE